MRLLLCFAGLVALAALALCDSDKKATVVQEADGAALASALEEHDSVVVVFVHTRKHEQANLVAMNQLEKAAEAVAERDVVFLAVDCNENTEVCKEYEVNEQPSIRVYSGGAGVYKYTQAVLLQDYVTNFIKKYTAPKYEVVKSFASFKALLRSKPVLVMVVPEGSTDKSIKSFEHATSQLFELIPCYMASLLPADLMLFTEYTGLEALQIGIVRPPGNFPGSEVLVLPYEEEQVSRKRIVRWAKKTIPAQLYDLNNESDQFVLNQLHANKPLFETIVPYSKKEEADRLKNLLRAVVGDFEGRAAFSIADSDKMSEMILFRNGVSSGKGTYIRQDGKLYVLENPTKMEIRKFVNNVLSGAAKPVNPSERPPENPLENGVVKVVASTYRKIVLDGEKDVVVFFYLDHALCKPCADVLELFEHTAAMYAHHPEIVFAKVDLSRNYDMPAPRISNFPSIRMMQSDDKFSHNVYEGGRNAKDLGVWVLDAATFEFKPNYDIAPPTAGAAEADDAAAAGGEPQELSGDIV